MSTTDGPVARVADGSLARTVVVLTASDRSAAGKRDDASGDALEARLSGLGFVVERQVVEDDRSAIAARLREAAARSVLIVTTGGTGLTLRDVTPQATLDVVDYEVPGLAEAMRAEGRAKTPFAALSRSVAGVRGRTLIVNTPGSPKAALESLDAIVPVLDHALETLAGRFDHDGGPAAASTSAASASPAAAGSTSPASTTSAEASESSR